MSWPYPRSRKHGRNESGYRLLNSIFRFVNHIRNGTLSHWSLDALLACSLITLRKKDESIRSVAVGNVFRSIASNLAAHSVRTRVPEQLRPVQVAFCVASGAVSRSCNSKIYYGCPSA